MKRFIILLGLLFLTSIPANARTSCTEIRETKGEAEYEKCRVDEKEYAIKENIKKHKDALEDQQKDTEDYYEDIIGRIQDRRKDLDRRLEREEDDESDRLKDLKDDDADKEKIVKQKEKSDKVKNERKAAKKYFDAWLDVIETQQKLDEARIDLEAAQYEYQQRGGSTQWIRWY
ncbi:hypothetical protein KKC44_05495 [Patescibacteria group bacterium]|nr:hypothetical protein [Patescibacteria group bacterium]MBU2260028.1 hypothetical protein [Patescibacteria group bacterium]